MANSAHHVFYSWQSDLPAAHNRTFIEGALEDALRQINAEAAIESSPRPDLTLDKDTKGVAGSPAITDTIVKKIKGCAVFVGDLSFVAQSLPEIVDAKKPIRFVPNPNVVIEHTYATDFHGEERVIAVVNEAYGGKLGENLPFNLRHRRWPIRYTCGPQTSPEEKRTVRKQLVADLVTAIRLVLDARRPAPTAAPFVGNNFSPTEFARQAKSGDLIVDGPLGEDMAPYVIPDRCIITLRLQPTVEVRGTPKVRHRGSVPLGKKPIHPCQKDAATPQSSRPRLRWTPSRASNRST